MPMIKNILANKIIAISAIFLISSISLMMALMAQYVFDLEPCILCLYQRVPFYINIALGFIDVSYNRLGRQFESTSEVGERNVTVVEKPFYDPKKRLATS